LPVPDRHGAYITAVGLHKLFIGVIVAALAFFMNYGNTKAKPADDK
jgi:hypothetical protein